MNIGLFQLPISPCVSFGSLCLSRVWSILFIKLVGIDLFILILCYPLNIHKSVVKILLSFLILVICDFFLFFSLVSLGRSLSILLIFSKNKLQVLWNFLFCFLFPISLILAPLFHFFYCFRPKLSSPTFQLEKHIVDFTTVFFSNINIIMYIQWNMFLCSHCFFSIPQILISCRFIFIQFKIF